VGAVLNSADFADAVPAPVYHPLLDEGTYLASPSTMYRILRERDEVRERRRHATLCGAITVRTARELAVRDWRAGSSIWLFGCGTDRGSSVR
jgi:hypothetical protein